MASSRAPDLTPLTSGNTRVKDARKLARRAFRAEHRTFLADGPKAVEGALGVPGCVIEVFATVAATEQYAALRDAAPAWTLVDDRALASLSEAVNPQGVVARLPVHRPAAGRTCSTRRPGSSPSAPTYATPATPAP